MKLCLLNRKGIAQGIEDNKSGNGFTLLEVVIAICILSIGLLAIASMQITAVEGNASSRDLTEATSWAQGKTEELMALPYTNGLLNSGNQTDPNPPDDYTITWNIVDNNPVNNSKLIPLTVSWQGRNGQRSTQLSCIKYRWL